MASILLKFHPKTAFVSVTVVLMFCALSASKEVGRRCYWCGPLADQVHRSERAPSCDPYDDERRETECESDYKYCAIIVTAPPFIESRMCVKVYHDDCDVQYCNSTQTWRMVCPCKEDLCNVRHTDRENDAFAILINNVSKSMRFKRDSTSKYVSVKSRVPSDNNTILIVYNKTATNDSVNQEENPKHVVEPNTIIELGDTKINNDKRMIETKLPTLTKDDKNDKTIPVADRTTPAMMKNDATTAKPTSIQMELTLLPSTAKPGHKLPPAEALQQNVSPTNVVDTSATANGMNNTEREPAAEITTVTNDTKNSATNNISNIATLIISLLLFSL